MILEEGHGAKKVTTTAPPTDRTGLAHPSRLGQSQTRNPHPRHTERARPLRCPTMTLSGIPRTGSACKTKRQRTLVSLGEASPFSYLSMPLPHAINVTSALTYA